MKKILTFLLLLMLVIVFEPSSQHHTSAQENIYGGVQSPRYVSTNEVIWWQQTANPTLGPVSLDWSYGVQCKNGSTTAGFPYFYDHGESLLPAVGQGSGFGKQFPCNGYLTFASAVINSGNIGVGNDYVQILVLNSMPGGTGIIPTGNNNTQLISAKQIEQCLLGVNASSFFSFSWPGTGCRPPSEGPGLNQSIAVTTPAAGANFQFSPSATVRTRIINIQYTLVTSAAAGNRFACVNFLTGGVAGTVVGQACAPYAQQPSQTVTYQFMAGIGSASNCSFLGATQTALLCADVSVPLPSWWESVPGISAENFAINSAILASSGVSGIQAADQISGIQMRFQIWQEID